MMPYVVNLLNIIPKIRYNLRLQIFFQERYFLCRHQVLSHPGYVIDTLEAVLWCIFHTTTYKDAVLTAVNLGDDTDTVGAITGGIAGIIYGLDAIPEEWVSKLVNKMMVFNAASDLYKRCNKDNIIDNLNFSV